MNELKNCPFCGEAMKVSTHPVDTWAVCPTAGCIGARQIVVLEDAKQVAAWNRRATPEGLAVVPVKPTEAMLAAGNREIFDLSSDAVEAWAVMLAVSKETER